jgi:hypothetical protein
MAGVTTNNGWDYPSSTDYVKDGATAIQTLATDIDTSTGKGLIAWQSWAPVLSNTWLNGNGVWDAKYCQIGKTVHVRAQFTLGTTTTKGASQAVVSLPVTAIAGSTAASPPSYLVCAGATTTLGYALMSTTSTVGLAVMNAAGTYLVRTSMTATVPATFATNDVITFSMTYEAA